MASEHAVIVGGSGHARVVHGLLDSCGISLAGLVLESPEQAWPNTPVLGSDDWLWTPAARMYAFYLGIGMTPARTDLRERLYLNLKHIGLEQPAACHSAAFVARGICLSPGAQIMAGAILQPGTQVGENVIVNTGARIDHDCTLYAHCHVAPGATLCGSVNVGVGAFIGAGAVVLPGVSIGDRAQVAAGATVIRDIPAGTRFIPGKPLRPVCEIAT